MAVNIKTLVILYWQIHAEGLLITAT